MISGRCTLWFDQAHNMLTHHFPNISLTVLSRETPLMFSQIRQSRPKGPLGGTDQTSFFFLLGRPRNVQPVLFISGFFKAANCFIPVAAINRVIRQKIMD